MKKKDPLISKKIGKISIKERIGQGGMAVVYKGYNAFLKRYVAVKFISHALEEDKEHINRFLREAQSIAKVEHPNIVKMYDAGEFEGRYYMAMEFLEGSSLDAILKKENRIPWQEAVSIVRKCVAGLKAIYEGKIIHRDIKPSNIIITHKGDVKIMDFGLAKDFESTAELTHTGQIMGTPHYISPEQCEGKQIDFRSDIYSLGATFYRMITGRTPYGGNTPFVIIHKHLHEQLPIPHEISDDIPPNISDVICRMMAKDPAERFSSYRELDKVLMNLEQDQNIDLKRLVPLIKQEPDIGSEETETKKNKTLLTFVLLGVFVISAVVCGMYWLLRGKDIKHRRDTIETLETAEDNSTKTIQEETRVVPKDDTIQTGTEIDNMQGRQDNKLSVIQKKEEQSSLEKIHLIVRYATEGTGLDPGFTKESENIDLVVQECFLFLKEARFKEAGKLVELLKNKQILAKETRILYEDCERLVSISEKTGSLLESLQQEKAVELLRECVGNLQRDESKHILRNISLAIAEKIFSEYPVLVYNNLNDMPVSIAVSNDHKKLALGLSNGKVMLIDIEKGRQVQELSKHSESVECVEFNPVRTNILASGGSDSTVVLWDISTGQWVETFALHKDAIRELAFNNKGTILASASDDATINLWDMEHMDHIKTLTGHTDFVGVAGFTKAGEYLYSGGRDKNILLWNTATGEQEYMLEGHTVTITAMSSYNTGLYSGSYGGIIIWDMQQRKKTGMIPVHNVWVLSIYPVGSGRYLIAVCSDNTIKLWDLSNSQQVLSISPNVGRIIATDASRERRFLCTCGDNNTIKVWDLKNILECLEIFAEH